MITKLDPKETARQLHREGFPVLKYIDVQKQREERLKRFEAIGIPALIDAEKELIAFGLEVINHMKILNLMRFMKEMENTSVEYLGITYYFEHRLAKDGEICLATTDPKLFCNGLYTYSSKDPGDGMAFVVTATDKDEEEL
jgi:hypothetical protein